MELEHDLDLTRQRLEAKLGESEAQAKELQDLLAKFNQLRQKETANEETNNR